MRSQNSDTQTELDREGGVKTRELSDRLAVQLTWGRTSGGLVALLLLRKILVSVDTVPGGELAQGELLLCGALVLLLPRKILVSMDAVQHSSCPSNHWCVVTARYARTWNSMK